MSSDYIFNAFRKLPVAVNALFGDPLQEDQWGNTINKIEALSRDQHIGNIAIITKLIPREKHLKYLYNKGTNIILIISITGLNENDILLSEYLKGYIKACSYLHNTIMYMRPIIPKKNDKFKIISRIVKAASKGTRVLVARPYFDLKSKKKQNCYKTLNLIKRICHDNNVMFFSKTSCASSKLTSIPCPTHVTNIPKNIELIKRLNYPISWHNGAPLFEEKFKPTKGDINLIRMLTNCSPKYTDIVNTTLISFGFENNVPLDCTSSWITWGRQVKCKTGCWYCIARNHETFSQYKNIGCLPSEMPKKLIKSSITIY